MSDVDVSVGFWAALSAVATAVGAFVHKVVSPILNKLVDSHVNNQKTHLEHVQKLTEVVTQNAAAAEEIKEDIDEIRKALQEVEKSLIQYYKQRFNEIEEIKTQLEKIESENEQ